MFKGHNENDLFLVELEVIVLFPRARLRVRHVHFQLDRVYVLALVQLDADFGRSRLFLAEDLSVRWK